MPKLLISFYSYLQIIADIIYNFLYNCRAIKNSSCRANYIYQISKVSLQGYKMTNIVGIDEAGRGPVIGPLVICGAMIEASKEHKLKEIGARDSKELTALQRERLFDEILKLVKNHKIIIIQPHEIDIAVESDT